MNSFREIENLQYGICLNSCKCQVFNTSRSPKTYEVIKRGSLAQFQYRKCKSGLVRTLVTNKSEVYMQDSFHYISIDLKLFKYLNAINDFEERVQFYTNYKRRQFVLHLERNSDVSVSSSGQQTKAVFQEIYETEKKIFITVELLDRPFKYSLPANMVNTIDSRDNRSWLEKLFCVPITRNFFYSTLEEWRCYDNAQNRTTCIVKDVEPIKKKIISQNPAGSCLQNNYHEPHKNLILDGTDFTDETVGRNSKRDENHRETRVDSPLIVPSSLPVNLLINSEVCDICSNVCEDNICRTCCNNQTKNMFSQNNSQINVDSDISSDTRLLRETPLNPPEINTYHEINNFVINEADLSDKNLNEDNICLSCDTEKISGQNNSQSKIDSRISLDTNLSSETLIIPLEINTHVINEDHLPDNNNLAVRHNISASNCIICKKYLNVSDGFFLILCQHTFCELCIKNQINLKMLAHTNIMPCCDRPIEQEEIKYFLFNHEYEQFKALFKQQCFDKNCSAYHLWEECVEEGLITFNCNKCKLDNCLKCEAIHVNLTCEQYDKITGKENSVDKETAEMFLTWIREGIAMPCPKCEALIEKDEGCDWVQCPFCNIEICWATRGPRWGPDGKGDTSGGCGCDFKVKKCVENCNYCH